MSNVKRSYNTSRRIRKGCKLERLIRFVLMRPLRTKTKVLADEYIIESPINWTRKIILYILLVYYKYNKFILFILNIY